MESTASILVKQLYFTPKPPPKHVMDKIGEKYSLKDIIQTDNLNMEMFEYDQRDIDITREELQIRQSTLLKLKAKNKKTRKSKEKNPKEKKEKKEKMEKR
mmetsp:Transcript_12410/g.10999  ORF Transcript_12410/g.10999 Transcript_12410/m.10999 type:complete len:100 (-) Transcript_12410:51-350(-)